MGWITSAKDTAQGTAQGVYHTASDGLKSLSSRASNVKVPEVNIEVPRFFRDLFGGGDGRKNK